MDEYDTDLTQDGEEGQEAEQQAAPPADGSAAELAKLREQNRKLSFQVHKSGLEAKYGSEIAELVPETLPFKEWETFADKLVTLRDKAAATAGTTTEVVEEAPAPPRELTQAESTLAAVASPASVSASGSDPYSELSAAEIGKLAPGEREKAMQAKYGRG